METFVSYGAAISYTVAAGLLIAELIFHDVLASQADRRLRIAPGPTKFAIALVTVALLILSAVLVAEPAPGVLASVDRTARIVLAATLALLAVQTLNFVQRRVAGETAKTTNTTLKFNQWIIDIDERSRERLLNRVIDHFSPANVTVPQEVKCTVTFTKREQEHLTYRLTYEFVYDSPTQRETHIRICSVPFVQGSMFSALPSSLEPRENGVIDFVLNPVCTLADTAKLAAEVQRISAALQPSAKWVNRAGSEPHVTLEPGGTIPVSYKGTQPINLKAKRGVVPAGAARFVVTLDNLSHPTTETWLMVSTPIITLKFTVAFADTEAATLGDLFAPVSSRMFDDRRGSNGKVLELTAREGYLVSRYDFVHVLLVPR